MAIKISTAARTALANALNTLANAGSGPAVIQIRTGAPPTNVSDADSGTLLGTLTMSDPAFTESNGVLTAGTITSDTNADASGDAGHIRMKDSDGNTFLQGTAGNSGDSPDFTFDNKSIVAGGTIAASSLTITVPVS